MELFELALEDLSALIESRTVSPVEVAASALVRLTQVEPQISAFATVTADRALADARAAEREISSGINRGPLHGIPYAVKDLVDVRGYTTRAGSRQHPPPPAVEDSAVVEMLGGAGMVLVGKTHTHEFGCGSITPQSRNPWNLDAITGGSSGGSAAAVAAGVVHIALGTDTGGSVRIPASLCGTVGLKPTFGRVSRHGVVPLSASLDHVGILARHVPDAAWALSAMSGYDRRDPASIDRKPSDFSIGLKRGVQGLRVGIPVNYFNHCLESAVLQAFRSTAQQLEDLGAKLIEVHVPRCGDIARAVSTIVQPEAHSYHHERLRMRPNDFAADVRRELEKGGVTLATDYVEAQRMRTEIRTEWMTLFNSLDVLLAPTVPATAPLRLDPYLRWDDGSTEDAISGLTRLSSAANLTGFPALQLPAGLSTTRLPLGVQLIGLPFSESLLLRAGHALQMAGPHIGLCAPQPQ